MTDKATADLLKITRSNSYNDPKIINPGAIQINVKGAFIVDEDQVNGRLTPPDTRDIALPHQTQEVSHVAVDIGGTLAKVVYFTKNDGPEEGGRLNFVKFETQKLDEMLEFLKKLIASNNTLHVMATGGGSVKFYDLMKSELGINVTSEDEMECLIWGLDFFIRKIPEEVFKYTPENPMRFYPQEPNNYPYMLVNMGSGVSMIKVTGPREFVRIGGSSLGGGTLWGLLSLLTEANNYDEMLQMAQDGDNAKVDMLVGDIYGDAYPRIGLKANTIASSFGKVFKKVSQRKSAKIKTPLSEMFSGGDISRSLLYAISNNIGQIAYLQAQNHQIEHIYFGGSYIRGHLQTMHTLSYAINFWSKGTKQAYFLRHEGYLGAVGAFLKHKEDLNIANNK